MRIIVGGPSCNLGRTQPADGAWKWRCIFQIYPPVPDAREVGPGGSTSRRMVNARKSPTWGTKFRGEGTPSLRDSVGHERIN